MPHDPTSVNASYPAGPASVPENLTKPTQAYKRHVWLAVAGLGLFVALYLFFAGWFAVTAWKMLVAIASGRNDNIIAVLAVGGCSGFLALFMIKSLFFIRRSGEIEDIEITPEQQPRLFEFLHRLADEAGAPRPHRVYLAANVNAAVFYDLSIINLLWPSRKNLVIGLGLVNVLTLAEFKAVCAHEFGHFAQRTMAVGRWVYIAQQIASDIVAKRDAWDDFLSAISRIDIRIAWVGWILQLIVWSIRSLMDSVFRIVILAQRALSREMEMQADLVAVSLTGSDALIHALHKLQAADDAWDRTLSFLGNQVNAKHIVKDAFAIQSHLIELLGKLFDDPNYGKEPPAVTDDPQTHRVFEAELAQPPRMWSTHPFNHEREENAKRKYVAAPLDSGSAWDIFEQPQPLREQMTAHLLRKVKDEGVTIEPMEDSMAALDEQFNRVYFDRAYRGVYLGRSAVIHTERAADLYNVQQTAEVDDLTALYPDTLNAELERLRQLQKECALLEALRDGAMKAPDGIIRHRGQQLRPRELPATIASVKQEADALNEKICDHDRRCRTVHRLLAARIGHGWEDYLIGLNHVLHYATHVEAHLRSVQNSLGYVINIATAARKVSESGISNIMSAAENLQQALGQVYVQKHALKLDDALTKRMETTDWPTFIGEFELGAPTRNNINDWLRASESWVNHTAGVLVALKNGALEQLLLCETQVADHFRQGTTPDNAPEPSCAPKDYVTLLPGNERPPQMELTTWQRFLMAEGWFPALGRFAAAGLIVGSVLGFGNNVGHATLTLYNGLAREVSVQINGQQTRVAAASSASVSLPTTGRYTITTTDSKGQPIETLTENVDSYSGTVYNVAAAAPLVEWTAVYGYAGRNPEPRMLGAPHWHVSRADYLFTEPPQQISTKGGGTTRTVLSAVSDGGTPEAFVQSASNDNERNQMIAAHVRWDADNSPGFLYWLYRFVEITTPEQMQGLITARLRENPDSIFMLRAEQDFFSAPQAHQKVCERQTAQAQAQPDNADLYYLSVRCLPDEKQQNKAFLAGNQKWPTNPWLALAAGYAQSGNELWDKALNNMNVAMRGLPAMAGKLAIDKARIQRLKAENTQAPAQGQDLDKFVMLRNMLALETNNDSSGPNYAYYLLAHGDSEKAAAKAAGTSSAQNLLWLAAASDGASAKLMQQALAQKDFEPDNTIVWVAMALAARNKQDPMPYWDAFRQRLSSYGQSEDIEKLHQFFELARSGKTLEAERVLSDTEPDMRGKAYSMGLILLGKKAPEKWRNGAKYLLFTHERPYFY